MKLAELYAVNGYSDEQEPWGLADECEDQIDIRGEDVIVLCEDGVARWHNSRREWDEVHGTHAAETVNEIDDLSDVARFLRWMRKWWIVAELPIEADAAEERIATELPETLDMPRAVLCDYLQDANHPDAALIRRHTDDIGN